MEPSASHYTFVMSPVLVLRVALALLASLLFLPASHQSSSCPSNVDGTALERCRSRSCPVCRNAPASCSVDPTDRIVRCEGDLASCRGAVECEPCSRCLAYYGGNGTSFRFSSACISMDYPLDCDSVPTECERSDKVVLVVGGVEASLFHSNKLWCSCHGDNCTAKLAFRYNVSEGAGGVVEGEEGHVSTAWKDPAWISSQSSSAPHALHLPAEQMELQLYVLAIVVLSCVLFLCLATGLVLVGLRTSQFLLRRRTALANNSFKFQKLQPLE